MSRHLRVLLDAGIVTDERPRADARTRVFHLRPDSMVGLQAWLDRLQAEWDARLDAFKHYVDERTRS
jgi:hypothetical protein